MSIFYQTFWLGGSCSMKAVWRKLLHTGPSPSLYLNPNAGSIYPHEAQPFSGNTETTLYRPKFLTPIADRRVRLFVDMSVGGCQCSESDQSQDVARHPPGCLNTPLRPWYISQYLKPCTPSKARCTPRACQLACGECFDSATHFLFTLLTSG